MKSAQVAQAFAILHHAAYGISIRTNVRTALRRYEKEGNNTAENWERVDEDLKASSSSNVGGFSEILQVVLFDINIGNGTTEMWRDNGTAISVTHNNMTEDVIIGNYSYNGHLPNGTRMNIGEGMGSSLGLLNVTGDNAKGITLPPSAHTGYTAGPMLLPLRNDTRAKRFWDAVAYNTTHNKPVHDGFPKQLYPLVNPGFPTSSLAGNTTLIFSADYIQSYGGLLLGPLLVNETLALMSFTYPIFETGESNSDLLGFTTVVVNASSLLTIINDTRGLGDTGQTILVGPAYVNGLWNDTRISTNKRDRLPPFETSDPVTADTDITSVILDYEFVYLLPPKNTGAVAGQKRPLRSYSAVHQMYSSKPGAEGKSNLDAMNSEGEAVGVAYASMNLQESLADWGLLIEQSKSEAFAPITELQKLLLATVFGTFGMVMFIVWPLAHWSVRPIVRLKAATEKTTRKFKSPNQSQEQFETIRTEKTLRTDDDDVDAAENGRLSFYSMRNKFRQFTQRRASTDETVAEDTRRGFRIPKKVRVRRHIIHDELTEFVPSFRSDDESMLTGF